MSEPIMYVDRSNTREGKLEEVKAALPRLVEFVDAHEPQLLAYGMYLDPEGMSMTVTAIHPDTTSLELHLAVGGQEFRRVRRTHRPPIDRGLRPAERRGARGPATESGSPGRGRDRNRARAGRRLLPSLTTTRTP